MTHVYVLSILASFILVGCATKESSSGASSDRISPSYPGPAETSYCSTSTTYSGSVAAVSGTAKYRRRNSWGTTGSGNGGLGSSSTGGTHPATEHAIRYAEVRVTDSSGAVVQCAETTSTGTFSFNLPRGDTTYTVSINSRANNSHLKASVLNRPEQNLFYSLSTTINANSATVATGTLMALPTGEILAGPFNILDQLLNANEYLAAQVSNCSGSFTGCQNMTVAGKATAYWEKGYNPNSYFNAPSSGLSFYLPGYSRLFILGGINGDTDNSDTDHFDDSVIIHEYGHFLEDTVFKSDSPGGSHDGNSVVDPRLAWSEGWGNFFQGAVRNVSKYTDTLGNDDGTTRLLYHADLETAAAGNDQVGSSGEGNFREFSVTRLLWDAIDSNADSLHAATDNVSNKFPEIWASLTKTSNGFKASTWAFRNVGHLHIAQQALGATNWSTLRTIEWQDGDTSQYARYMSTGTTCAGITITPSGSGSSYSTSNQFTNNDFLHIKIASAGTYTIRLEYEDAAAPIADLDLYLYKDGYTFATSSDVLGQSVAEPGSNTGTKQESITVSLGAGNYMINVNDFYTGSATGRDATYKLYLNGGQLCPATLP